MAYEEPCVTSLGRTSKPSSKAKAKAKAKEHEFVLQWREEALAREAAEELRAAQREVEVRSAWRAEAATEEDPWGDMADLESEVDNPPGTVVHADTHGVPCTVCHAVHRGPCSFHDVLRAEIAQLQLYADNFLPPSEDFHSLRALLYTLMGSIRGYLVDGGLTPVRYRELLSDARILKRHCDSSVYDSMYAS